MALGFGWFLSYTFLPNFPGVLSGTYRSTNKASSFLFTGYYQMEVPFVRDSQLESGY